MAQSKLVFKPVNPVKGSPVLRYIVLRDGKPFGKLWTHRRLDEFDQLRQAWHARLITGEYKYFTQANGGLAAAQHFMRFMEAKKEGLGK